MNTLDELADELAIVSCLRGEHADDLNALLKSGKPLIENDFIDALGTSTAFIVPTQNSLDDYAVEVFDSNQRQIGFVWMCQAFAIRQWMAVQRVNCVRIRLVSAYKGTYIIKAVPEIHMDLTDIVRKNRYMNVNWAVNLPQVLANKEEVRLALCIDLLKSDLMDGCGWNEEIEQLINNLLKLLPTDLSGGRYVENIELFMLMKNSTVEVIRELSSTVLLAFVKRCSDTQIRWWTEEYWPGYIDKVVAGGIPTLFKIRGFTLYEVERLLNDRSDSLFSLYRKDKMFFAKRMYYLALPQEEYNRLLTLLAVWEWMRQNRSEEATQMQPVEKNGDYVINVLGSGNFISKTINYGE